MIGCQLRTASTIKSCFTRWLNLDWLVNGAISNYWSKMGWIGNIECLWRVSLGHEWVNLPFLLKHQVEDRRQSWVVLASITFQITNDDIIGLKLSVWEVSVTDLSFGFLNCCKWKWWYILVVDMSEGRGIEMKFGGMN